MQIGGQPFIAFENSFFFFFGGSLNENVSLEKRNAQKAVTRENTFGTSQNLDLKESTTSINHRNPMWPSESDKVFFFGWACVQNATAIDFTRMLVIF